MIKADMLCSFASIAFALCFKLSASYAFGAAAVAAEFFLVLADLTLPKDLLKILPLLVLISPLPITNNLKFVV